MFLFCSKFFCDQEKENDKVLAQFFLQTHAAKVSPSSGTLLRLYKFKFQVFLSLWFEIQIFFFIKKDENVQY